MLDENHSRVDHPLRLCFQPLADCATDLAWAWHLSSPSHSLVLNIVLNFLLLSLPSCFLNVSFDAQIAGPDIPHHPDLHSKHLAGSCVPQINGILQNDSAAHLGREWAPSQSKQ